VAVATLACAPGSVALADEVVCAGTLGSSTVDNVRVPPGRTCTLDGTRVAFQNRGGVSLTDNVIRANLQCKANRPAPVGGGNVVDGNREDQCERA
jgi:hypothetical protein